MKEDTRKRISELILEELSEKIKRHEGLRKKLESFADLPVEKVAAAILNQFEYVLSSDLRELIIYLIEQEVAAEKQPEPAAVAEAAPQPILPPEPSAPPPRTPPAREEVPEVPTTSIMEHFATKELFPTQPMDIELKPEDWFYMLGVSYAPVSTGKGVPMRKLLIKGVDGMNNIFLLDYGDVRFYMNRLTRHDYALDKTGKPILPPAKASEYKFEHERILNQLRGEDVIMPLPFWTIMQGRERIINRIEDNYVELLRILIDVHDAVEWDVEIFVFDQHVIGLPAVSDGRKERTSQRDLKHPAPPKGRDVKILEKLMMREKGIAQDIHSSLLLHSSKAKIDYMIRLDNAFMDDWKSILAVRYTVGKDKRKNFWQEIRTIQAQYEEYRLMIRVANPNTRFTFSGT